MVDVVKENVEKMSSSDKNFKLVRAISIILILVFTFVLIIIKVNIPTFKLSTLFISIGAVVVFFIGVIIAMNYIFKNNSKKDDKEDKIPKPISLEQAREIAKKALLNQEYLL